MALGQLSLSPDGGSHDTGMIYALCVLLALIANKAQGVSEVREPKETPG